MRKRKKICLIDADSLLYESASVHEVKLDFGNGAVAVELDPEGAKRHLDRSIARIVKATRCGTYELYITGPSNFRYEVLPTYKSNRKDVERPQLLGMLREYVLENHPCHMTNKIEADDACCIKMTRYKRKYILAHIDKDLNQVEGEHYCWRTDTHYKVTYAEGQRLFFKQVLSGDPTDGYSGCIGIGSEKADKILDTYMGVIPYEYEFKKGPRKGEIEIRWHETPMDDIWDVVVSHYLKSYFKAGVLNSPYDRVGAESLALQQARVARMLRNEEWVNNEVILWSYEPLGFTFKKEGYER